MDGRKADIWRLQREVLFVRMRALVDLQCDLSKRLRIPHRRPKHRPKLGTCIRNLYDQLTQVSLECQGVGVCGVFAGMTVLAHRLDPYKPSIC